MSAPSVHHIPVYGLYKNSQGSLAPHWTVVLVLTIIGTDFSQALLLGQISDSTTTFRKNLDI